MYVTIPLIVTGFACGAHYVLAPTSLATWGPQTPKLIKSSDHRCVRDPASDPRGGTGTALYVLEASRTPYALYAHRMHAEYPFANLDDDVDLE